MVVVEDYRWKNRIKNTISHLTQTLEYRIIRIFSDLGYDTSRYYYVDFNPKMQQDVLRELDFKARTLLNFQIVDKTYRVMLSFIGDIKFHPEHDPKVIRVLGLYPHLEGTITRSYLMNLFSWRKGKEIQRNLSEFEILECLDVHFFSEEGKPLQQKKSKEIRSYFEQICSGVYSKSYSQKVHGLESSSLEIAIPTLIFGNRISFLVGNPEKILSNNYKEPNTLIYLFQSANPSRKDLIPILMTSSSNLAATVKTIEDIISKELSKNPPPEERDFYDPNQYER